MRNVKIFTKLFLSHTALGLGAVIILSIIFYFSLRNALIQRTVDQLSSINILKKDLIENYFEQSERGIKALHIDNKFFSLFSYVTERDLIEAENKPEFKNLIDDLLDLYGFENVIIFDRDGQQIFTTSSEAIYSGIMNKVDSLTKDAPADLHLIDLSDHVSPLKTVVVHYVPVYDSSAKIGVVLLHEDFTYIDDILLEHTGMGNTGETYLVGPDFRMRSASRFFPDSIPMNINVSTEAVKHGFRNSIGPSIIDDYRGISVLSTYRPFNIEGMDWVIISEMDFEEAMEPIIQLRNYLAGVVIALVLVTLLLTYILSNVIAQPIVKLRTIIQSLSKGVIPHEKPVVKSSDEIGQITEAMVQLMNGLERTTTFAKEIGSGNFESSFTTLSEKDSLGLALIQMRDELQGFHVREITMARERASALIEGQEYERQRITQDLHDGVGQLLTSIRIRVELMENDETLKQDLKNQINETIAEIKRISYNVMPQALVDYGLEAALKGLCDNIGKFSPVVIDFRYIKETQVKHDFELSTTVFRIVQEGLNNIIKHSKAKEVNLHILDRDDSIYLILEDDGVGFDEKGDEFRPGSGLHNMKERAKLLNGTTEIHSIPGTGTVIEVTIPIKVQHHE